MSKYREMTLTDLFKEARTRQVPNYASMLRYDLIRQLEAMDEQERLKSLYQEAERRGIRGYSMMSEEKLRKKMERQDRAQEKLQEQMAEEQQALATEQQEESIMAAKKKKTVRKTTKKAPKTVSRKTTRKSTKGPQRRKATPRKRNTTAAPARRTRKTSTSDATVIANKVFDYAEFGRMAAKEVLKIKGLTIPMANQHCRAIVKREQLTGPRREAFNQGWLEVMQRYLVS